jgi:hypothetical protein
LPGVLCRQALACSHKPVALSRAVWPLPPHPLLRLPGQNKLPGSGWGGRCCC